MQNLQYISQNIAWCSPLTLASQIDESHWILLYSGVRNSYSGRYSFLACGLREQIKSDDFLKLSSNLSNNKPLFENAWFGYLGYELKNTLEDSERSQASWLNLPALHMMRFGNIYQFDHDTNILTLWSDGKLPLLNINQQKTKTSPPSAINITSNMTHDEYLNKAECIIKKIHSGDLYQANLTRKFYGEFTYTPNHFQLFEKLCAVSPAPYSAFIRLDDNYILSSSPESFLNIDTEGNIITRPIKGTAPRSTDKKTDDILRKQLQESEKDRAENLMIVDLMRNDLSKSCVVGSIKTDALFDVTTHATIHHLSSTVSGKKTPDCSTLDVVKAAFPAGSMTGAPKISAINLCAKLEKQERGVYSGAIGWFGGDGSCDLSVVIRTLLIKDKKFEFQVGGGIVADSTPQNELEELINKAKGILLALEIPVSSIKF
jgi:para-aminobenzoate synthetase component 1